MHNGNQFESRPVAKEKTGRKNIFSPGLSFGVMTPKIFGAVVEALMPLSFCFFLRSFASFCHRLFPPFQSAEAEGCEDFENKFNFTYNGSVIVTFFLSNNFLAHLKIFLPTRVRFFFWTRARIFPFARCEKERSPHFRHFPFPIALCSHRLRR